VGFGEGRPEIKDTRIVFEKSSVTMFYKLFHSPQVKKEPEDAKSVGTFTLDTTKKPTMITFTWENNPWNDRKDFTQRGIYALEGDNLKLCMSLANDDKQLLPKEFSAPAGSQRHFCTFKRESASEKGGEKPQQPGLPDVIKVKPPSKPAEPAKEGKDALQGTWRMVTGETEGLKIGADRPEIKENRLVFDQASVTFFAKRTHLESGKVEDTKSFGTFTLDTTKNPRVIVLTWETNPWNDQKDFTQRGIYVLEGDSLKLCLSLEEDDRKLPTEFSASFGSKRTLLNFKREPASDKGGEKKP
jgi:uncharacterized protein (TIGR03067 family)